MLENEIMDTIYHLRIKQEHASRIIEELIQANAVEELDETASFTLSPAQEEAIDAEIAAIAANKDYLLSWDSVKERFEKP